VRRRGSLIFLDNLLTDGCDYQPYALAPFTPGRSLVLISVGGRADPRGIVRLEGLGKLENPITSSGIESATFLLVPQCLKTKLQRAPFVYYRKRPYFVKRSIYAPNLYQTVLVIL
jgi:hypothetical protein